MSKRDAATRRAFAHASASLGVLLQNVWITFNPETIVLGGDARRKHAARRDHRRPGRLRRTRGPDAAPRAAGEVRGDLAAAVGGAAYVLHATLHPHRPVLHTQYVAR